MEHLPYLYPTIAEISSPEDSAAQIVEVVWPLSAVACRSGAALGSKGVLPLRTFIQETLRRSRTSYSTLQVALYYLIVIKSHVPNRDFTMEQTDSSPAALSLQCGRRMFLAALILASKYLQDRNYSARAWSKISGLSTQEVNTNEMVFLTTVNWRLHISEPVFQRWTDIVLQYTSPSPPSLPSSKVSTTSVGESNAGWISIIPRLTPQLDTVEIGSFGPVRAHSFSPSSPSTGIYQPEKLRGVDPTTLHHRARPLTPPYDIADNVDSRPYTLPPLGLAKVPIGILANMPTPQLTPPSSGENTPAVSADSISSRQSSIGRALAHADRHCIARTTLDGPSSAAQAASALLRRDYQTPMGKAASRAVDQMMVMEESNSDEEMLSVSVDCPKTSSSAGEKERAIRCRRRRTRQTSERRKCHPSHQLQTPLQSRGLGRELSGDLKVRASSSQIRQLSQYRLDTLDTAVAMSLKSGSSLINSCG